MSKDKNETISNFRQKRDAWIKSLKVDTSKNEVNKSDKISKDEGDGDYYSGKWDKDKMSGTGEYHYTKEKFPYIKGNFQSNKPNGTCTYYKSKSVKYTTYWEKGSCTKVSK